MQYRPALGKQIQTRGAQSGDAAGRVAAVARPSAAQLPVFVINRDSDFGRRTLIGYELQKAGLKAIRVRGVDGLALPPHLVNQFYARGRLVSDLTPGEVGCYASHLLAMQAVVDQGLKHALILEDDARLCDGLATAIAEIVANAPRGWGVIHLCRDPLYAVKPVVALGGGRALVRYSRVPAGMVGYLVSQEGARQLTAPRPRYWPCDTDLRQPWRFGIDIYGVTPSLITHDRNSPSVIGSLGGQSKLRRGLPRPAWHCWTGNPMHSPAAVLYNIRALGLASWIQCGLANTSLRLSRALAARRRRLLRRAGASLQPASHEPQSPVPAPTVAAE